MSEESDMLLQTPQGKNNLSNMKPVLNDTKPVNISNFAESPIN